MQIDREPHLNQLRDAVKELQRIVDGEPNEVSIAAAWRQMDQVKAALSMLAPNHPGILGHL